MIKIGALWSKKDRNKNTMFSGEIECPHCKEKTRILGFFNKYKKPENKQPNYNLYMPDEVQQPEPEPESDEPYVPERDTKSEENTNSEDDTEMPF